MTPLRLLKVSFSFTYPKFSPFERERFVGLTSYYAALTPQVLSILARANCHLIVLTAVLGAFASSLTLAISEVTARADIPFLTMSFADEITGRGLESVFQVVAKASLIGRAQVNYSLAIAEAAGSKFEKIAIMYEDTAYGVAKSRGLRRAAKDANIEVVMDESIPWH